MDTLTPVPAPPPLHRAAPALEGATLLAVDSSPIFLDGLRTGLAVTSPGLRVLCAPTLGAATLLAAQATPGLMLISARLLAAAPAQALARLAGACRDARVLVLVEAGAPAADGAAAGLDLVGGVDRDEPIAAVTSLLDAAARGWRRPAPPGRAAAEEGARAAPHLSRRQTEVLIGLMAGKSNKTIAWELGMSQGTVKIHIAAVLRSLGVRNRTQAAVAGQQLFAELAG